MRKEVEVQFRNESGSVWCNNVLMYRFKSIIPVWRKVPYVYTIEPNTDIIQAISTIDRCPTDKDIVMSVLRYRIQCCGGCFSSFLKENKKLAKKYHLQETKYTTFNC